MILPSDVFERLVQRAKNLARIDIFISVERLEVGVSVCEACVLSGKIDSRTEFKSFLRQMVVQDYSNTLLVDVPDLSELGHATVVSEYAEKDVDCLDRVFSFII